MEKQTKPVGPKERIEMLDIIRGFALFGVLMANMLSFKAPVYYYTPPLNSISSAADSITAWFIKLFIEGKFYTIFSLLFGLGFYIFMERASAKTDNISKLFKRRISALLVFGLVHLVFLWTGDVLNTYALAGFILLRKWKLDMPKLKRSIIAHLILATVLLGGIYYINGVYLASMDFELFNLQMMYKSQDIIAIFQEGTFIDILKVRISNEVYNALINNLIVIPNVLVLFLMGLYIGKSQVHKDICRHKTTIKKTWLITLVAGVIFNTLLFILMLRQEAAPSALVMTLKEVVKYYAGIIICFFYISSIVLIGNSKGGYKVLKPLAYIGRMALTNYLLQTIICVALFNGYGLGFYGKIGYFKGAMLTIAIYAMQLIFSKVWLSYFTYGPMELVWRRLTYGSKIKNEEYISH